MNEAIASKNQIVCAGHCRDCGCGAGTAGVLHGRLRWLDFWLCSCRKLRKEARYNGVAARNPRRQDKGLGCLVTFTSQGSMRLGESIMRKGQRLRRGRSLFLSAGASAWLWRTCYTAGLALFGLAWTKASARSALMAAILYALDQAEKVAAEVYDLKHEVDKARR